MDFSQYTFRQISSEINIKPFDCGDSDLNEFLLCDAKDYFKSMMALTYLLEDESADKTVAYYSLLNDKIVFDPTEKSFWNRLNRKVPNSKRRKEYPAVKIGRLAVAKDYCNLHIGSNIILLINHIFATMNRSACRFLTVDAYAAAIPFYKKCGFLFLSEKDRASATRAMYFDLINYRD